MLFSNQQTLCGNSLGNGYLSGSILFYCHFTDSRLKMNATFHITADYMSYITAVAEFILSVYSQLTRFRY